MLDSRWPNPLPADRRKKKKKHVTHLVPPVVLGLALIPLMPFLGLVYAPRWAYKEVRDSEARKRWCQKRAEQRDRKPPKPIKRKRALSISEQQRTSIAALQQELPPLCRLPTELKLMIYDQLVGRNDGIHVVFEAGQLCAYRCQWSPELKVPARHLLCWYHFCNEHLTNSMAYTSDRARLGVLGFLQSCRPFYNDFVPHLYSRPRFLFHDFDSFAAFSGAIIPSRFNTLQRVEILRPSCSSLPNMNQANLSGNILSGQATYKALHDHKFEIRNPILPILPLPICQSDLGKWIHVKIVLRKMEMLKELKVVTFANTVESQDRPRVLDHRRGNGEYWMNYTIDRLWPAWEQGDEWTDFDATKRVFSNGITWQGVKILKKKDGND